MIRKTKIEHSFLKDRHPLERMNFTAEERDAHLSLINGWHSKTPDFEKIISKIEQTGFWNNLHTMPMPELINYMLKDRRFKGETEQLYLNKIKEILDPENSIMMELKEEKNKQKRLDILNKEISDKLIDEKYFEAEILHLCYTADFNNLKYISD